MKGARRFCFPQGAASLFPASCLLRKQEFTTAKDTILSVYPDAKVLNNCVNSYPIKVKISKVADSGQEVELYSTDQRNLFKKYAAKRATSIQEIKRAISAIS
jgi:hypothetical protein